MPSDSDTKKKIASEVIRLRISQMIVNEAYKAGKFKVPIHLAMGHEAIAVAVSEMMEAGDGLLPTHRNIAYNLARAGKLQPILDEYLLKPTGLNQAHSGSMNLLNPERGIPFTSSILGNQFSVATGVAMANKILGKNNAVIVMGGDGSIEEGSFYESMLMARSMGLPVLFVVENNEWSMSTRIDQRRSPIDVSLFAKSLDIRYAYLGDNDVYHYIDALKDIRKFAVENSVPTCIEVKVSTLGDWRMKTQEFPEGEFINYHAGPAPEVSLTEWPMIRETDEDPVFALTHHIEKAALEEDARRQFAELQKEIS
jgi:TPP-dependent pyruvate/acetoin dehydrogenase alpha subunit